MSAQAQAGPCALANGWGGHPGRSSSWALGGGAQGQQGWWEKQQGEGGGDGGPSAPPGLAEDGDGSAPSPYTLNPDYLAGLCFQAGKASLKPWTPMETALEAKGRHRTPRAWLDGHSRHHSTGSRARGHSPSSPWQWVLSNRAFSIVWALTTTPFPFGCWEAQELQQACIPVHGFVQTSSLILCHALPLSSSPTLCLYPSDSCWEPS